jgi:hypothetical protein
MNSNIDLEAGQVAQATPRAGAFFHSFSSLFIPLEVLTVREEEVGNVETHEMDTLGPHTSRISSSPRPMSTGQNTNDEAQLVISQVQGASSICPCFLMQRRLFYFVTFV